MFDRHVKRAFVSKKEVISTNKRLCIWLYIFLLRNGIRLGLKTTHIVC